MLIPLIAPIFISAWTSRARWTSIASCPSTRRPLPSWVMEVLTPIGWSVSCDQRIGTSGFSSSVLVNAPGSMRSLPWSTLPNTAA
jgi:hypothetical protein